MFYKAVLYQFFTPSLPSRFFTTLLLTSFFLTKVNASDVDSVSPIYGTQGSSGLTVTIILEEDTSLDADQDTVPDSVTLGELSGSSITRADTTTITADFTIDSDETLGARDLEVAFSSLNGAAATYTKESAFWVTEDDEVSDGYILYTPIGETTTYLVDNDGDTQKSWESDYSPALSVYFLEDGTLMRTASADNDIFEGEGGAGGIVEQYDWDGNLLWTAEYSSDTYCAHHDIAVLPNGNILMLAWQLISEEDAIAAGRDPSDTTDDIWVDSIVELDTDGDVVWQWNAWDHLVQDYDSTLPNYVDDVSDYPERINVNYTDDSSGSSDWLHMNSIDYNEDLNQILVSVHNFSEVWIIDHSTTTDEAASSSGGNSGMGGDLLYRWGNPAAYNAGSDDDQILVEQHDATWIASGYPGEGNILVFNNDAGTLDDDQDYSSVVEFTPPLNDRGLYDFDDDLGFYDPVSPVWTWEDDPTTDFYAQNISGAQRQLNGNTIISNGPDGYVIEVNSDGDQVWGYEYEGDSNVVFRFERYTSDFAGFDGTELDDETAAEQYFGVTDDDDDGWIDTDTFGEIYIADWPYVYIADQQSWFCFDESTSTLDPYTDDDSLTASSDPGHWIYDFLLGWFWTSDTHYPWSAYVELEGGADWSYFGGLINERRYFFFVNQDQWRGHVRSGVDAE